MEAITNVLAAFGLSGSAGLNAYVPLLVVALTARFSNLVVLNKPWDTLESWWVIGVLAVLVVIEFFADKVPAVNHANDVIQTFVRPTAGAILFAASTSTIANVDPAVALILGLLTAGTVHVGKSALLRPAVTATTGGVANPVVSTIEDVVAFIVSVVAVLVPALIVVLLVLLLTVVVIWLLRRSAARPSAR